MPKFFVTVDDEEFGVNANDEDEAQRIVFAQLDQEKAGQPSASQLQDFTESLNEPEEPKGVPGLKGVVTGAGKSLNQGITGLGLTFQRLGRGDDTDAQMMREYIKENEPQGTAEHLGAAGEQIAEFAVPGVAAERAVAKIPSFAGRQLARGGVNAAQQTMRQGGDVNGSTAAAGVMGATFGAGGEGIAAISKIMANHAIKNAINVIQPTDKESRLAAGQLAKRFIEENLFKSARQGKAAEHAKEILDQAGRDVDAYLARWGDAPIDADAVRGAAQGTKPPRRADGGNYEIMRGRETKAEKLITDTESALGGMKRFEGATGQTLTRSGSEVPLKKLNDFKRDLDDQVYYNRAKPARSDAQASSVANMARHTIAENFPELGKLNLRYNEMRQIADMLETAQKLAILPRGADEAAAAGALLTQRYSIPAMKGLGWLQKSPKYQALSGSAKLALYEAFRQPSMGREIIKAFGKAAIPDVISSREEVPE